MGQPEGRRRGGRWKGRGQRVGGQEGPSYGALDLGTNNCRLLIAQPLARREDRRRVDGFRVVDAFSRIVRLGQGVDASGRLSDEAMTRALSALSICARKLKRRGLARYRAVATEACRRAENYSEFLGRVERETGLALEVISQDEESDLAAHGCAPLMDPAVPDVVVFDIGGGSTQVSWLRQQPQKPCAVAGNGAGAVGRLCRQAWCSLPIGVVTLAERYGGHDITPDTYSAMRAEVAAALAPFEKRHGLASLAERGCLQMLGTSGTVTTLAGMHQKLPRYDRSQVDGCFLGIDTVKRLSTRVAAMTYEERLQQPCIGGQRADLVVAGCAILEALCGTWPVARLRVADRGLREGILVSLMDQSGIRQSPGGATAARPS